MIKHSYLTHEWKHARTTRWYNHYVCYCGGKLIVPNIKEDSGDEQ